MEQREQQREECYQSEKVSNPGGGNQRVFVIRHRGHAAHQEEISGKLPTGRFGSAEVTQEFITWAAGVDQNRPLSHTPKRIQDDSDESQ